MTQPNLKKIHDVENQIGRKLTDVEIALWVQLPSLTVVEFIYGINFQNLIHWLKEKLGRPLTLAEMKLVARLLREGNTYQEILNTIHPTNHKNTLTRNKP